MRAAVYIRVSTDEQARDGVSLDMQEDACRRSAEAAGATSIELFRDDGYTGTNPNRPALRALVQRLPHSRPPYGYSYAPEGLEPHPDESPWVAAVFGWYAEGESLQTIAQRLNSLPVPQQRGGSGWQHTHVIRMLSNPAYLGMIQHRGEVVEAPHEPLVDDAL